MLKNIDITKNPTAEQIAMLARASQLPIPADDEYPAFSETELMQFKRISSDRQANRNKQTVTLRLSPQALQKAKSLGKGYTSVLSRILESALENPEIVKHNL
ncbi:MAG: BrnA antitoxin family protein [Oscillospiraceae bacterium]